MLMDGLWSTIAGGLLALGGAWIGPHFQRRHERWRAKREDQNVLRQKAQELFDELDRLVNESQQASLSAIARLQDKSAASKPVPDLGGVRAIAAIYFPSSLSLVDAFENENQQILKSIADQAKVAVDDGEKGLGALQALPMIMAVKYLEFAGKFVRKMREHLKNNVPQIELK
jgi:hypothetical protein